MAKMHAMSLFSEAMHDNIFAVFVKAQKML